MLASRARQAAEVRVALSIDDTAIARDAARALAARGLAADELPVADAVEAEVAVIAFAPELTPDRAAIATLAGQCERAAHAGRPVVMLAVPEPEDRLDRAVALAYLRSFGAIVCEDPDTWLETVVLVAAHGLPAGPAVALVAPPGTWLSASAAALAAEWAASSPRPTAIARETAGMGPADIALIDAGSLPAQRRSGRALLVPVVGRAELIDGDLVPLVGLRAALAAATAAGRFAARLAAGLGPDREPAAGDDERFDRQLAKVGERAGDHETKVFLACYGVPITRQAVATTASAATRLAKRAGFPVEVKPWGPDVPSERDGCPVETGISTAAEVRRAFTTVTRAAEMTMGAPVIVRATPPEGREVHARIARFGELGWMVVLHIPGAPGPVAAPAPLSTSDAADLARRLEATRADDPEPDREALAAMLRAASSMVIDRTDVFELVELSRVVVTATGQQSVVVDAWSRLKPR